MTRIENCGILSRTLFVLLVSAGVLTLSAVPNPARAQQKPDAKAKVEKNAEAKAPEKKADVKKKAEAKAPEKKAEVQKKAETKAPEKKAEAKPAPVQAKPA